MHRPWITPTWVEEFPLMEDTGFISMFTNDGIPALVGDNTNKSWDTISNSEAESNSARHATA